MLGDQDTVAAIATARGVGALGIVRLSGPKSFDIISKCFNSKEFDPTQSHKAFYGLWKNPLNDQAIDEVLVLNFTEGRGFTGEISAEVICHGGIQVTEMVLESMLAAGCRLARPGEFTYRAVMNGRMNLAQAESVLELIEARTPRAVLNALKNIRGAFSQRITKLEDDLIFLMANLEAAIDFTTEDIQPVQTSAMLPKVRSALETCTDLLKTYVAGRKAQNGVRVALAGKPNSGKSSLLNALVGRDRSIVTDQPGTTRDTVEEDLMIEGQLFRLIDTAGLRDSGAEVIEKMGIERAYSEIDAADAVLYVIDSSIGLSNSDAEIIKKIGPQRCVLCFNKIDLLDISTNLRTNYGLQEFHAEKTSTRVGAGLNQVREKLLGLSGVVSDGEMSAVVSTQRQKELLETVSSALVRSVALLESDTSPEFVAFELREALTKTQEILGKSVSDDVMDRVFKEFCIGK